MNGEVIPYVGTVSAPNVEIKSVPDPKIINRKRARLTRELRQSKLQTIWNMVYLSAKDKGHNEEDAKCYADRVREDAISAEKDDKYETCHVCHKNRVYNGFTTCYLCRK